MKIPTDEVEEHPVLGFELYANSIVDIIRGPNRRFSIGIYGEWGTGKTTLMKLVNKKLTNGTGEVLTVWFNAWRYEREEHLAIIPLMKTIAYAMGDHPIYKEIKPVVIRSLKIIAKGLVEGLAAKFLDGKTIDNLMKEENIFPYIEFLTHFDKDTIYFEGIHNIEKEMEKILGKHPDSRIVVFIDDLDRCSPKRALEVFESVKVFLDIKGFVFVIGLSHETLVKLINAEYQTSGIKGEEYIRKIIQTPITLPTWNKDDAKDIINNLLKRGEIDENYSKIIEQNKDLIASVVQPNPREAKRFITSFLISYNIHSQGSTNIEPNKLLLIQAIQLRWPDFYNSFVSDRGFRWFIDKILDEDATFSILTDDKGYERFENVLDDVSEIEAYRTIRKVHKAALEKMDVDLISLLRNERLAIFDIHSWEVYRRAVETSKELPTHLVSRSFTFRYRHINDTTASEGANPVTLCVSCLRGEHDRCELSTCQCEHKQIS